MSSSPYVQSRDRRLQIEVLRLRASYERLELMRAACSLQECVQPAAVSSMVRGSLRSMGMGYLGTGLSMLRGYPLVMSLLRSVLANRGRRRILMKAALLAGLVWLGKRNLSDHASKR